MKTYTEEETKMEALDLLLGVAQYIEGKRETKPTTNNCDAIELIADALKRTGII